MRDKFILILLLIIVLMAGALAFYYAKAQSEKDKADNAVNYVSNNGYGVNEDLLKALISKDSVLQHILKQNNIRTSDVKSVSTIVEKEHYYFSDTSKINPHTGKKETCLDFDKKGIKIQGCNGSYRLEFDRTTYVVPHYIRQSKKGQIKTGPFRFLYKRVIKADAYTNYGDTLDVKIIER